MGKHSELLAVLLHLLERTVENVHAEVVPLRVGLEFDSRRALDVLGKRVDELVDGPLVLGHVDFAVLGRRFGELDLLVGEL